MNCKLYFLTPLFLICSFICNAQKHHIGVSGGLGPLISQYSLQYEYTFAKYNNMFRSVNANIILGRFGITNLDTRKVEDVSFTGAGLNVLLFSDRNSLEVGSKFIYYKEDANSQESEENKGIIPGVHLGYRYAKNNDFFRIGLGLPELVYIGYGLRF